MTQRGWVALALAGSLLLPACTGSDTSSSTASQTPAPGNPPVADGPAEPGLAPAPSVAPVGRTIAVGNNPEAVVVGSDGTAAVGLKGPDGIALVDVAAGTVRQVVPTDGGAPRHLDLAAPGGPVLAPLEQNDTVLEVSLADGAVLRRTTEVGRNPHNAVRTADGTVVVNNELGGGVVFLREGAVVGELPAGPPQPGGLAAVGGYAVVSDVRGQGLWVYDAAQRTLVAQTPLGTQLTHTIALAAPGQTQGTGSAAGVVAVADTVGEAVYLVRVAPPDHRQGRPDVQLQVLARIAATGRPYGLAYDAARALLFITRTADNQLAVVDVADPRAPRTLGTLPTVRQPNSVAVDPASGEVLVAGNTDGLLQVIPQDQVPSR
ncbi:hypothetical protein [Rhodococcus sp. X156]|uniref:YncE family protein n=1 Tax=Rhodococcus sp. X156 TaxID=2499145 RepID=UPI000FDA2EE4|nr:hypothetical protein [Rhodococcus sp. X156]